ncbi:MAG: GlxA family transcriptional regulator [Bradyrhizobium sp.]|uniref:GlxA family transcriptional regulator n=1 Tax=Bradyrhizobium sp. TaxID=376 RepID=UPI0025C495ED|nr:GlxA family transcriptional regulator [Bradyrhizobium sp.]MBI5263358.1 GlxA family transcriptional regulator [Bradyrhizobium sp.]
MPLGDVGGRPVRRIGFLLIENFSLMSFAAAVEPLRAANVITGRQLYSWSIVAPKAAGAATSSGARLAPDLALSAAGADRRRFDDVFVCAGGNPATFVDEATFAWLRRQARRGTRMGGVSGGTWILARAGLMAGYRCTIHWEHVAAFREAFAEIDVRPTLFEIDRDRLSCAGGIASLDLMHALIEADFGAELARRVSEWFLQTSVRTGDGSQRMEPPARFNVHSAPLAAALALLQRRYTEPIDATTLAQAVGISTRHLQRLFLSQLGTTLERHLFAIRLDHARQLLRQSTLPVLEVALASGFVSASHFSRAYKTQFGISPRQERQNRAGYRSGTHSSGRDDANSLKKGEMA